jgi:hypothetical protein
MPLEQLDDYVAVGVEQLNVAIDLFVADVSYISALVLAVAAEEQFARAIQKRAREKHGGEPQLSRTSWSTACCPATCSPP